MKQLKMQSKSPEKCMVMQKLSAFVILVLTVLTTPRQGAAQSWPDGSHITGTNHQGYVVNKDRSNVWSYLRLQTSTNKAWNIAHEENLWWGYSTSSDLTNRGTKMMTLTTEGDLGIGTTNPAEKLDVNGNINSNGYIYSAGWGSNAVGSDSFYDSYDVGVYGSSGGNLNMISGGGNGRIYLKRDGNVGIGTTTPAEKLDVQGNIHSSGSIYSADNLGIGTTSPTEKLAVEGNIYSSGNIYSHGDIGIGTTTPAEKLDVQGNIHSSGSIYSAGNLGIGTTSPTEKLTVEGNISASGNISSNGHVSIGAAYDSVYSLKVNGDAYANTFVTSAASFPDYVFEESYELMPLPEMEAYVRANHHLPNMPAEREVVAEGMNLNEVLTSTVENVESIYLHLIRLEKKLAALEQENRELKRAIYENQ